MFVFSDADIREALREAGEGSIKFDRVGRSGDGTALRLEAEFSFLHKHMALVLRLDGTHSVIEAPTRVWYMNDRNDFVAWFDDLKRALVFPDGTELRPAELGTFGVDPSGRYFFVEVEPGVTGVGLVDRPSSLVKVHRFVGRKIFAGHNRVFLFDMGRSAVECRMLVSDASGLTLTESLSIPRAATAPSPYYVEDMDVHRGRVILRDVSDGLAPSRWYVFDLTTERLEGIGWARGHAFFLAGDILDRVKQTGVAN